MLCFLSYPAYSCYGAEAGKEPENNVANLAEYVDRNSPFVQTENYLSNLEVAVSKDEQNARLWSLLGAAYYKQDDFVRARRCYRKVVTLSPANSGEIWLWLGTLDEHLGDAYTAIEDYQTYLSHNPDGATSKVAKVRMNGLIKDPKATQKILTKGQIKMLADKELAELKKTTAKTLPEQ